MCPEKVQVFNNVSMSRYTVVQRVEALSASIKQQLSNKGCVFDFYSVACDESTDATVTTQLLIFLRGMEQNFGVTEELLDLKSKMHNNGYGYFWLLAKPQCCAEAFLLSEVRN